MLTRETARLEAYEPYERLGYQGQGIASIASGMPGQYQSQVTPDPTPLQTALGTGACVVWNLWKHNWKRQSSISRRNVRIMRTLRRPMFRRGGSTGEGITSGLSRQGYDNGNTVQPRRPNSNLNNFLIDFGLDLVSRPPQGGIFATAASAAKDPFSRFQARDVAQKDREWERKLYDDKMAFEREKFKEEKRQFGEALKQDRYLGELEAQGEKQFIEDQIDAYWNPLN